MPSLSRPQHAPHCRCVRCAVPERPPLVERPRGEPDTSAGFLVLAWLWIGGCLFVSAMTAMVSDFCPAGWEKRLQADLCESRVNRVWMALLIGQLIIVGIAVLGTVLGRSALVGVAMAMAPLAIIAALLPLATPPTRVGYHSVR